MYRIGQLCKKFNLSRSTLLYYDSIDLLTAEARTASNYRAFSDEDVRRLEQIALYRSAGVPLKDIKVILNSKKNITDDVLEKRLAELNDEIRNMELQRKVIVLMLKNTLLLDNTSVICKDNFISILEKAGLDYIKMNTLHSEFERLHPEEHQKFLEFLGIPPEEIKLIREHSKRFSS